MSTVDVQQPQEAPSAPTAQPPPPTPAVDVDVIVCQAPPALGLPSLSVDCIRLQALLKFHPRIRFAFDTHVSSDRIFSARLPVVCVASGNENEPPKSAAGFSGVYKILCERFPFVGANPADGRQKAEAFAFEELLTEQLYWILLYEWFSTGDVASGRANFNTSIRPIITEGLSWPYSWWACRRELNSKLAAFEERGITLTVVGDRATQIFSHLSARLGEAKWFYGSEPSSLDATVFAYLYAILQPVSMPCRFLSTILLQDFPNLVKYTGRIASEYFSESPLSEKVLAYIPPPPPMKAAEPTLEEKNSAKRRRRTYNALSIAFGAAVVFSLQSAWLMRLLSRAVTETDDSDEAEDDGLTLNDPDADEDASQPGADDDDDDDDDLVDDIRDDDDDVVSKLLAGDDDDADHS